MSTTPHLLFPVADPHLRRAGVLDRHSGTARSRSHPDSRALHQRARILTTRAKRAAASRPIAALHLAGLSPRGADAREPLICESDHLEHGEEES